jgi:hypothetical protein
VTTYYLTFRLSRLMDLLADAGFTVAPPRDIPPNGLVRFVSSPDTAKVVLEAWTTAGDWREWTGRKRVERPTEDTPVGRYL